MTAAIAVLAALTVARCLRTTGLAPVASFSPTAPRPRRIERQRAAAATPWRDLPRLNLARAAHAAAARRRECAELLGCSSSWGMASSAARLLDEKVNFRMTALDDEGNEQTLDALKVPERELEHLEGLYTQHTEDAETERLDDFSMIKMRAAGCAVLEPRITQTIRRLRAEIKALRRAAALSPHGGDRPRLQYLTRQMAEARQVLKAFDAQERAHRLVVWATDYNVGAPRPQYWRPETDADRDRSATLGADFGCYLGTEEAQEELEELLAGLAADHGKADLSAGGHFEAEENGSDLDDSAPRKLVSSTRPDAPARPKVSVELDELPRGQSRLTSALAAAASAQSASISSPLCTGKATLAQRSNARQQAFTHPTIGPRQQTTREMWRNWRDEISRAVDQMPDALRGKLTRVAKDAKQNVRAALKAHVLANLTTSTARAANPAEWRITPTMAANYRFRAPGELQAHIRRIAVQREARTARWLSAIARARNAAQLRRFAKKLARENTASYQASVDRLDRTLALYTAGQMIQLRGAIDARKEAESWR